MRPLRISSQSNSQSSKINPSESGQESSFEVSAQSSDIQDIVILSSKRESSNNGGDATNKLLGLRADFAPDSQLPDGLIRKKHTLMSMSPKSKYEVGVRDAI